MNLEIICKQTCDIAIEVGDFIRKQMSQITTDIVESKGRHDFVTYVDKTAEKQIVAGLEKILPEAGFIAEEQTNTQKGDRYNWVIDPLDGTTNYIHGLAPFAVSIALMDGDEVAIGVVYEISLNECFYAWKDSKAYLNGKEITVSKVSKLDDSFLATGFPYYDFDLLKEYLQLLEYFLKETHGVRRLGSAATDLVYVACGRFDAFYEYSLHPWDVAAGAFIVQRAGGKVCDFKGCSNYIFGKEMIATNHNLYDDFMSKVLQFLH